MYTDLAEALADTKGIIWQLNDATLVQTKSRLLRLVHEITREQNLRAMAEDAQSDAEAAVLSR